MAECESWNEDRARGVIAAVAVKEGATLPVLHALQAVFGCVPLEAEQIGRAHV